MGLPWCLIRTDLDAWLQSISSKREGWIRVYSSSASSFGHSVVTLTGQPLRQRPGWTDGRNWQHLRISTPPWWCEMVNWFHHQPLFVQLGKFLPSNWTENVMDIVWSELISYFVWKWHHSLKPVQFLSAAMSIESSRNQAVMERKCRALSGKKGQTDVNLFPKLLPHPESPLLLRFHAYWEHHYSGLASNNYLTYRY